MPEIMRETPRWEDRLEKAESLNEILDLVNEVMISETYVNTGKGGDLISKANKAAIAKFGRRAYFNAFDEKFGPGLAEQYMRPPADNE